MAIESVDELEDRVRVNLFFRNGVGIPDEHRTVEVLLEQIRSLPSPPDLPGSSFLDEHQSYPPPPEYWSEQIEVAGETIEFQFYEIQENVQARIQGVHGGPYRVIPSQKG